MTDPGTALAEPRDRVLTEEELRLIRAFVAVHITNGNVIMRVTPRQLDSGVTVWTLSGALTLAPDDKWESAYVAFSLNMGFTSGYEPILVTHEVLPENKVLVRPALWEHPFRLRGGAFPGDDKLLAMVVGHAFHVALHNAFTQVNPVATG